MKANEWLLPPCLQRKWTPLVLVTLREGALRFLALHRKLQGVSRRMLTLTLRDLERDGFVARTYTAHIPPKVNYSLTTLGHDLLSKLQIAHQWLTMLQPDIDNARRIYDSKSESEKNGDEDEPERGQKRDFEPEPEAELEAVQG